MSAPSSSWNKKKACRPTDTVSSRHGVGGTPLELEENVLATKINKPYAFLGVPWARERKKKMKNKIKLV